MSNAMRYVKKKPVHYSYESVLDFGRYKGKTVEYVVGFDPDYLVWAAETIEWFDLDEDVLVAAEWDSRMEEELYRIDWSDWTDD